MLLVLVWFLSEMSHCTRAGVHKQTKLKYAIKVIDKKYMNKNYDVVMAEVKILKEVGSHRYIVKLVDTFQDDKHFYLIMEFCGGGTAIHVTLF